MFFFFFFSSRRRHTRCSRDWSSDVCSSDLKAFVYPDDEGRVLGFGGLAAAPMHHRLEVDGRTLWTWCAWDSLFIPEILGKRARVDRKSTRLNSSHGYISYAVFCLKKKKNVRILSTTSLVCV